MVKVNINLIKIQDMNNSCIYNGMVSHTRFKPVHHQLKYKTFSLLIDLDEIEELVKIFPFFL